MKIGYGLFYRGRWFAYLDTDRMFVGRDASSDRSVVYAVAGLVFEHYRPHNYRFLQGVDRYPRIIRKWQRIRDQAWKRSKWTVKQIPGETLAEWTLRRWQYLEVRYGAEAADARARGEAAPRLDDLEIEAPLGVPIVLRHTATPPAPEPTDPWPPTDPTGHPDNVIQLRSI